MRHDSMCNGTSQKCKLEIRDKRRKHWWWLWQAGGYALWGRKQTEKISQISLEMRRKATQEEKIRYSCHKKSDNLSISQISCTARQSHHRRCNEEKFVYTRSYSTNAWLQVGDDAASLFFFLFGSSDQEENPAFFEASTKESSYDDDFSCSVDGVKIYCAEKNTTEKRSVFFSKVDDDDVVGFRHKDAMVCVFFGWSGECWTRLTFHRSAAAAAVYFHAIELHFLRCARSKRTKEKTRPDLG